MGIDKTDGFGLHRQKPGLKSTGIYRRVEYGLLGGVQLALCGVLHKSGYDGRRTAEMNSNRSRVLVADHTSR